MTLSQIMQTAHILKRTYRSTMSVALKMAWGLARGFTYAVEASFVDWNGRVVRRAVFLGNSYEECTASRQAAQEKFRAEGLRFLGGHGTNLKLYAIAPVAEAEPARSAGRMAIAA
jgi:hypothetical protein